MNLRRLIPCAAGFFTAALLAAGPGEPQPLWPRDLAGLADKAPPDVASVLRPLAVPTDEVTLADGTALRVEPVSAYLRPGGADTVTLHVLGAERREVAGSDIVKVRCYETAVAAGVEALRKADDTMAGAWAAEQLLRAGLRFSRSRRQAHGAGDNPWAGLQAELSDRLVEARQRLLQLLAQGADLKDALHWADVWLPLYGAQSRLGDEVRAVWVQHARQLLKDGQAAAARKQLTRAEETFGPGGPAEPLRQELRGRAEALLRQARELPDAKALVPLQQALALWPRLPELRDTFEKRRGTYQVLYVAVRELPEFFSPALAFSDAERQTSELVFEGLVRSQRDPRLGMHERPQLAAALIAGSGVRVTLPLRRDAFWADGEAFTAADVRHTVELLARQRTAEASTWRELLETPRLNSDPFRLPLIYRQGLRDPWLPLRTRLLPQHAHGKALTHADDVDFARRPIGTGPYLLQGKEGADGRVYLVLRTNPNFVRQGERSPESLREIRLFAWKDGTAPGQPLPHLVLDPLPAQVAALKKAGYTDFRSLPADRAWFLAVNHRRPALANAHVRLALAHAIDRRGLLGRHLASAAAQTLNGLFPRGSWANCPTQRVPEELYRPEDARTSARRSASDLARADWTLKYPADDPRLDAAFKELAEQVGKLLATAGAQVTLRPIPLGPRQLQAALRERDFDLLYTHLDEPDTPAALWPLFDPHPDAVNAGGSNYLGYDQDAALQTLLRSALHHRDFAMVRDFMQGIHARLYATMPLIPLWQLPYPVAVHSKLRTPDLDALAVFGSVLEWKVTP